MRDPSAKTYVAVLTESSQAVYGADNLHQAYKLHQVVVEVERFESTSAEEALAYWEGRTAPDWAIDEVDARMSATPSTHEEP